MTLNNVVDEGYATPFSSKRTITYSSKVTITVEAITMEHSHHTLVFHLSVLHDGIENDLAVFVEVGILLPLNAPEEVGYREQGTRGKPARYIVMRNMIDERIGRECEDIVLQLFKVTHTPYLVHRLGVTEDEIAETEVVRYQMLEIDRKFLGIFIEEGDVKLMCLFRQMRFRGLHDKWQEGVFLTNGRQQAKACTLVLNTISRETAIADDTQHIVLVLQIQIPRLLVSTSQNNLWTSSHTKHLEL